MVAQPEQDEPKPWPVTIKVPTPTSRSGVAHTATTLSPERFKKASAPSAVSVSKTVALSTHEELRFPSPPCSAIKREFERLMRQDKAFLHVDEDTLITPGSAKILHGREYREGLE